MSSLIVCLIICVLTMASYIVGKIPMPLTLGRSVLLYTIFQKKEEGNIC